MSKPMWVTAVAAVAGIGLAACGSPTSPAASAAPAAASAPKPPPAAAPMTAQQIAARLAPLGCAAAPVTDTTFMGIKPQTSLECTVAGETVGIDTYATAEQVSVTMKLAQSVGCSIVKSFGVTGDQDYVLEATTMVTAKTAGTSAQIHAALPGSTMSVIHCP